MFRPALEELLALAKEKVEKMTAEEREDMILQQARSLARAEAGSNDEVEAREQAYYREHSEMSDKCGITWKMGDTITFTRDGKIVVKKRVKRSPSDGQNVECVVDKSNDTD